MPKIKFTTAHFAFRKPRHPLLRVMLGVIGVGLLALLVVGGLFVGLVMLACAAVFRLVAAYLGRRAQPRAEGQVIDGEYAVVRKTHVSLPSR